MRRLGTRFAYVLIVLTAWEGLARWLLASDERLVRLSSLWTEPAWRLRWAHRHGAGSPPLPYEFDVPHPTRGWTLKAGLRDLPVFQGKRLSSNSAGLRGAREHQRPKPPGVRRLLAFGDSFTFGEEVGDEEAYPSVLESRLSRVEVLNFGVHGYGHDQMLLRLREEAAAYQPDVVLLGYVTDDALRNILGFRDFAKPRFRVTRGGLVLEGVPVPTPGEVLAAEPYRSRLLDLLTILKQEVEWRTGGRKAEMLEVTTRILDEFFTASRRMGARPVVVDLPILGELLGDSLERSPREQLVAQLCGERAVPYLTVRPRFVRERRAGARLRSAGHWGPGEHRMAAEEIADFLLDRGLLSPPAGAGGP